MSINKIHSRLLVAGLTASVLGITVQALSANQPAMTGLATGGAVHRGAGFETTGTSGGSVEIPIPITSSKTWALSARLRGNGSTATACRGIRYDNQNNEMSSASAGTIATTYQGVTLPSVNIPAGSGSSLTVFCDLPGSGGGVESIDFN